MSALLYFAFAAVVLTIARRSMGVSRPAQLILALLPLLLTGRAMFTGGIYGPLDLAYTTEPMASIAESAQVGAVANPSVSDVYTQFFPWNEAVRESLRAGQWPLWNRFELCGNPLAGAAQSAPYHPVTMVQWLVPTPDGVTFLAAAMFLLAALSAFGLAFTITRFEHAALTAAAIWMLSTHLISFAGAALAMSIAILPMVMHAGRRVVLKPGVRSALILCGALSLLLLGGHPESTLHVLTLAVPFAIVELVLFRERQLLRIIATALAGGLGALLLCAIYLLPIADSILQSEEYVFRASGYSRQVKSSTPAQMTHRLRANILPFLEGAPGVDRAEHPPQVEHGWIPTVYSGALAFATAIAAMFVSRRRERWFFAAAVVWAFAIALAVPGFSEVLSSLPLYSIAVNDRMVAHGALALAMLAAFAVEGTSARGARTLGMAALFTAIALAAVTLASDSGLDPGYVRAGAIRAIVPMLLLAAAAWSLKREHVGYVLFVLILVQRLGEASWMQATLPRGAWFPPFPGLETMRSAEPFRVVGVGSMLIPNLATHYGLEDVRGFEAMTLARYVETYPSWSVKQPVWSNRVDSLESPMLDMMNVRFAIIPPGTSLPPGWRETFRSASYAIVENVQALPRVWMPRQVHFRWREDVAMVMRSATDYAAEGWIDEQAFRTVANGRGVVRTEIDGSRLRVHASMESPGWLFVSNAAWRGWTATANGKSLPLRIANHAFLAFELPAGEHDVTLAFRPPSFTIGASITAAAALLLFGALLLDARRAKRGTPAPMTAAAE